MTTNSSSAPRPARAPAAAAAAAKASVYTRFIPREELGAFAAWEPSDLSRPGAGGNAARAAESGSGIASAEQIAEKIRQARQAGYQEGYRDGLVALEGFKQTFAHQTTLQVGALLKSLGEQLDGLQRQMAQTLCTQRDPHRAPGGAQRTADAPRADRDRRAGSARHAGAERPPHHAAGPSRRSRARRRRRRRSARSARRAPGRRPDDRARRLRRRVGHRRHRCDASTRAGAAPRPRSAATCRGPTTARRLASNPSA